jgi:hypothetical protein
MFLILIVSIGIFAFWLINKNAQNDAGSEDLSKLSTGRIKQSLAHIRMTAKNSTDKEKKASALFAVEKFEAELERRANEK